VLRVPPDRMANRLSRSQNCETEDAAAKTRTLVKNWSPTTTCPCPDIGEMPGLSFNATINWRP
jgi:hypothetical protein